MINYEQIIIHVMAFKWFEGLAAELIFSSVGFSPPTVPTKQSLCHKTGSPNPKTNPVSNRSHTGID